MIPSIKEVIERYKDAKVVECAFDNKLVDLTKIKIEKSYHKFEDSVCIDYSEKSLLMSLFLFNDVNSNFAKIISYKEPQENYIKIPLSEIKNNPKDAKLGALVRSIAENY